MDLTYVMCRKYLHVCTRTQCLSDVNNFSVALSTVSYQLLLYFNSIRISKLYICVNAQLMILMRVLQYVSKTSDRVEDDIKKTISSRGLSKFPVEIKDGGHVT